jgi:DNA invertase Pin-like site-specific DNA recombinase
MSDSHPSRPKLVAYYRVSTQKQGRSGLGLEAQTKAVLDYARSIGGEIIDSFQEVESGKNHSNRLELAKALQLCRQKKAVLVIARIDRLARNLAFVANLMESNVKFVCCDMPEATELTIHIVASVAQAGRATISKTTKEALAAAKARGQVLGNPRPETAQPVAIAARSEQARYFREGVYPLARQLRDRGLPLRQIAQEMNERHIPSCNGCAWYASTVGRLLKNEGQKAA